MTFTYRRLYEGITVSTTEPLTLHFHVLLVSSDEKPNVNAHYNEHRKQTALHISAYHGNPVIVHLLFQVCTGVGGRGWHISLI